MFFSLYKRIVNAVFIKISTRVSRLELLWFFAGCAFFAFLIILNRVVYYIGFISLFFALFYAVTIIFIVVAIAFFTVLERKVLASVQRRRGPNFVGFWGLLQAFADGLKLLAKEPVFVSGVNYYIFLFSPIVLLSISLTLWLFIPLPGYQFGVDFQYSFIVVLLFSGLNSYAIILSGIASNSRYSLIGGVRTIAQVISYEMPLSVSLLTIFTIVGGYGLLDLVLSKVLLLLVATPSVVIFAVSLLAETNRTPFDLPEAEAELVAGYNLEYSSILFSLFFLAEYSNMLVAASLVSLVICGGNYAMFYISVIFFSLLIILVRAILPRYTFAQMIGVCWCVLLPLAITSLIFVVIFMQLTGLSSSVIRPDVVEFLKAISSESGVYLNNTLCLFAICVQQEPMRYVRDVSERTVSEDFFTGTPSKNVIVFFVVAFLLVCALVFINWIFINFISNNRKNSSYECGFEPVGSPVSDFSPNFIAVALIFLIYDVEVLLSFPWAYSLAGRTTYAVTVFVLFLVLMLLGLIYEKIDDSFTIV